METFFASIEWVPVLVSFVLAFGLGALWYSPLMFMKPWLAGLGMPVWRPPMWMPMVAQAGSTFLLAILVNLLYTSGQLALLVLVALILPGFSKASGMYAGKGFKTIAIEGWYLLVMVLVLVGVNWVL